MRVAALPRERGEHGRLDRERHSRGSLIDARRHALWLHSRDSHGPLGRRFAAEEWVMRGR
jgi:hypothetical protein